MHLIHSFFSYILTISSLLQSHPVRNTDSCCMGGQYFFLSVITSCLMTEWLLGRVCYSSCSGVVMSLNGVCDGGQELFFYLWHRWARTMWMGTKAQALLEKDFFGSPTASENSYYFLPVLPLYKSCCRGIWKKVKMSLGRIVACNIARRNGRWWGISGKLHKTTTVLRAVKHFLKLL